VTAEAAQLQSVATILTYATTPIWIENYTSAYRRRAYVLSMRHDPAGDIASGDQRKRYFLAGHSIASEDIQIIQPTGLDFDENFSRARNWARPPRFQR